MLIAARNASWGRTEEKPPAYWGLCFTAEQAGSIVKMRTYGTAPAVTLETSYDGKEWKPFIVGSTTITLSKVGDRVYFRAGAGGNTTFATNSSNFNCFQLNDRNSRLRASGSIQSLLNGNTETFAIPSKYYCFARLFYSCSSLTQAPSLPATSLTAYCYSNMFYNCGNLIVPPTELPALEQKMYCYDYMFAFCSYLSRSPVIRSEALAYRSCRGMFYNCVRLMEITTRLKWFDPEWDYEDTGSWVYYAGALVSGSKRTFYCPTALGTNETILRGVSTCPEGWTVVNID